MSILIRSMLASLTIGFLWIGAAYSGVTHLSFEMSGLLAAFWFLPVILAAEIQREHPVPGLLFLCEALAALVAVLGPLGWVSLQFGLAQGAAAEAAYRLRRTPGVAALGALVAEFAVMAYHPELQFHSLYGGWSWVAHAAGALVSIFVATTLVVGFAMAWRYLRHSH